MSLWLRATKSVGPRSVHMVEPELGASKEFVAQCHKGWWA